MSPHHSCLCTRESLFLLELGSWGPFSFVCQTDVDSHSSSRLFQEMSAGKVAAGHRLVVAMVAVFLVVMGLPVFVDFLFLSSDSSGTVLLVLPPSVPPAE